VARLNLSKDADQARDVDGSHKGTHDPRVRWPLPPGAQRVKKCRLTSVSASQSTNQVTEQMHLEELITERTKIYASRLRTPVLLLTLLCSACAGGPDSGAPPAVPTPSITLAPFILKTPGLQPAPARTSTAEAKPGSWHGSGPEPERHRHGKHWNHKQNAPKRSQHPASPEPRRTEPTPTPSERPPYWPLEHLNDQ